MNQRFIFKLNRHQKLIWDIIILGIIGALSAQAFSFLLELSNRLFLIGLAGYIPPGMPGEGRVLKEHVGTFGLWLIPVVTTLGGVISGVLVYSLAPEAEGHGTDSVVKAFHRTGGFLRARVAPLKAIASAITIGSGGSAGSEGPTALISSAIGSFYGNLTKRSEEDRRLLLLVGMAAGLSAMFRSPIGAAIFAIEVLYSHIDLEARALLFTLLGSVVAYVINGFFVQWEPLFFIPSDLVVARPIDYLKYAFLGSAAGIVGGFLPAVFYHMRDAFRSLPVRMHLKPAIGALCLGFLAIALPEVLGGGYIWIQEAIDGRFALSMLLVLVFAKTLALGLTVSSGGSGGVFAPSLYIGAMLGAFIGQIFHEAPAPYAVVGMAAVFGAAAHVPVAALLMVTEMTGSYHLLAPAALSVVISYLIHSGLTAPMKYKTLYEAQVPRMLDSPAHQGEILRVAMDFLKKKEPSLHAGAIHQDLLHQLASQIPIDLPISGRQLIIGTLKSESPCIGTFLKDRCLPEDADLDIIAILRNGDIVIPQLDTILQRGDHLLMVVSPESWDRLEVHFSPLSKDRDGNH